MWPNSSEFCHDLVKGSGMLRRRLSSRPGRVAVTAVAAAAFLFAVGWRQSSLNAADAPKSAKPTTGKTVAASSSPSAPLPRVQKKVSDFGVPEVALINTAIQKGWSDHNLGPSKQATDGEWCRRVYLDLVGRVPTVEELTAYLGEHKNDKRERLVDSLLGDKYNDEYTRNWSASWTNVLIGRTGGNERKSLVNRDGMTKYLTETLKYNKPYDQMARELIAAVGSC